MTASMRGVAVRFWDALAAVVAACAVAVLLAPVPGLADTPRPKTSALTSMEDEYLVTPEEDRAVERQAALGYLRYTNEGWKLDVLPGAVVRTGPLPLVLPTADAAREDFSSHAVAPYAPLLRIDF